ncbi:SanA/YdcF family protein [Chondrinema litorale]|uniref:SanA/YdcF family protein n=1 Tax=Chondrinema litorale TaxID=2994555 RepID=UPI002543822D|nr:ElyC/SanA/YdcF family protein [Chondrinema litorale]UZR93418.1 YdcF family protein [Chondrinema litorale]
MMTPVNKLKLGNAFNIYFMRPYTLTIKPAFRSVRTYLVLISFIALLVIALCNFKVESYSKAYLYDDIKKVPFNQVGLVLGTSKSLANGKPNPYLYHRLEAATKLFKAGKVKYLLLSGDNHTIYYNEPRDMRKILIKMGVPAEAIILDYAGFRTLDSVIRCKEVFGQNSYTVISQEFHNKRAVFLGRNSGIETIAFNAQDIDFQRGIKVQAREIFARVKAVMDIFVLNEQPKFLGKKIQIAQN